MEAARLKMCKEQLELNATVAASDVKMKICSDSDDVTMERTTIVSRKASTEAWVHSNAPSLPLMYLCTEPSARPGQGPIRVSTWPRPATGSRYS